LRLCLRLAAEQDLDEAFAWYESQRPGLGDEFLKAVSQTFEAVVEHPLRYRVLLRDTRQALVRRFPYRVLYRIVRQEIFVVACLHAHQDPREWRRRD
jgi:plasmid stabilization system protein ParE